MFELCGGVCHERARRVFTMLSRWRQAIGGKCKSDSPKGAADFDYFRSCAGGGVASVAAHHPRTAATAILSHARAAVSWRAKLIIRRITHFSPAPPDQNLNCSISNDVPTDAFS